MVRGGSETILSSDTTQNGRPDVINSAPFQNFEPGRDVEVDGRGKITFQAVYRHTPGKDFPLPSRYATGPAVINSYLSKFRARLSLWQEANMVQVLCCTWYAEVLNPY